ncbi:MAG: hypothetical protein U0234_03700 [Sandaracinus sp.]
MPRCYLLCLAQSSSIDLDTNEVSLFQLTEEVDLQADDLAATDRFEIHSCWEFAPTEIGQAYDVRFLVTRTIAGAERFASRTHTISAPVPRLRMRTRGFVVPGAGRCGLRVEWSVAGQGQWNDAGLEWPLTAKLAAPDVAPSAP